MSNEAAAYARLEERVEAIRDLLERHTSQDMEMFNRLVVKIDSVDEKIDQLLLWRERQEGERAAVKRASAVMAGTISVIVAVAGLVIQYIAR